MGFWGWLLLIDAVLVLLDYILCQNTGQDAESNAMKGFVFYGIIAVIVVGDIVAILVHYL
jgi:hypothetical protein